MKSSFTHDHLGLTVPSVLLYISVMYLPTERLESSGQCSDQDAVAEATYMYDCLLCVDHTHEQHVRHVYSATALSDPLQWYTVHAEHCQRDVISVLSGLLRMLVDCGCSHRLSECCVENLPSSRYMTIKRSFVLSGSRLIYNECCLFHCRCQLGQGVRRIGAAPDTGAVSAWCVRSVATSSLICQAPSCPH